MTKKEKAILKLAQKWAKRKLPYHSKIDWESRVDSEKYASIKRQRSCGRTLLKILEGRDL